jgi:hypothetical protein
MDDNKHSTFGMRFSKINVLRYSQYDISNFDVSKDALIEYQTNFQFKIQKESSEIVILGNVKLFLIETKELFAELKVECFFELKPFDDAIKQKENSYDVPNDLLISLTTIVIGTIRGILHEKLKGTPLQKEVYPLMNTKELMNLKTDL